MEQFALITGVSVEFLLTGRRVAGKGPYPDVPGPHMIEKWRAAQLANDGKPLRKGGRLGQIVPLKAIFRAELAAIGDVE
jgi:hypothetical protein